MRLLPATVGTRLQKAGSNRWISEKYLTPSILANEFAGNPNVRVRGVLTGRGPSRAQRLPGFLYAS